MKSIFKRSIFISILILGLYPSQASFAQVPIPNDFHIDKRSEKVVGLINEFRKKQNLPEIKLSSSLSWVAYLHNEDLIRNTPDTADCHISSWSDTENWKGGCIHEKNKNIRSSRNKPKEIINYPAQGFELTFWENNPPNLDTVMNIWTSNDFSRQILENTGEWKNLEWNAIGASCRGNYILVWFGNAIDPINQIGVGEDAPSNWYPSDKQEIKLVEKPIQTNPIIPPPITKIDQIPSADKLFYLVIGTFSNQNEAEEIVNSYHQNNQKQVGLVKNANKYRIYWEKFDSYEKANEAKANLPEIVEGAWVLSPQ